MSTFDQLASRNIDVATFGQSRPSHDLRSAVSRADSANTIESVSTTASFAVPELDAAFDAELRAAFSSPPVSRKRIGSLIEKAVSSTSQTKAFISLSNDTAQTAVDTLQSWLDSSRDHPLRRKAIYILVKLAARSGTLPASLFVANITLQSIHPASMGGFADVYKGILNGELVALKRLRITASRKEREKMYQQFCREALMWRQLSHNHLLTFKGIDSETFKELDALCMVSSWMEQGNLVEYLQEVGPVTEVRNRMLAETATAIEYLHSQNIIHGDIRASNIFVDARHRARLADFGLIGFAGDSSATRLFTATKESGSVRYMAPELHDPERYGEREFRRTRASDVYAYGGLCFEVYTGKSPFSDVKSDFTVMQHILAGRRLPHPTADQCRGAAMAYGLYSLTTRCLEPMASSRPTMREITEYWGVDGPLPALLGDKSQTAAQVEKMLYGQPDLLEKFRGMVLTSSGVDNSHQSGGSGRSSLLSTVQAIRFVKELLERQPKGHPDRPRTQNNLGNFLVDRYIQTGDLASLDDALHYFHEALELTLTEHPDRHLCHINLSRAHSQRGTDCFDLQVSIAHLAAAILHSYSNPRDRLSVALVRLADIEKLLSEPAFDSKRVHSVLLDVYKQTIAILREIVTFSLDIRSRLHRLSGTDALAILGASHALTLSRVAIALEVLEEGRSMFWSQSLSLRAPCLLDTLPPDIHSELTKHLELVEKAGFVGLSSSSAHANHDLARRRREVEKLDGLLLKIRAIPGFDRFSLLPPASKLVNAIANGPAPLVVLLDDGHVCRAITITNTTNAFQCHSLRTLSPSHLRALAERIHSSGFTKGSQRTLEDIWYHIVKPVIDALQLVSFHGSMTRRRPRIHWCPTGLFSFLPLHAAGVPGRYGEYCTDYLVSSYTPSLHALVRARTGVRRVEKQDIRALLVAQGTAPGFEYVDCVQEEVKTVARILSPDLPEEQREHLTKSVSVQTVLDHLRGSNIFHLAAHGKQDVDDPLESGAYLRDGRLTVAKLMRLNLPDAFLAFLDADETAKAHMNYPDQAIHLCAAALFAGFRNVIGNMWQSYSPDGPIIVQHVLCPPGK